MTCSVSGCSTPASRDDPLYPESAKRRVCDEHYHARINGGPSA